MFAVNYLSVVCVSSSYCCRWSVIVALPGHTCFAHPKSVDNFTYSGPPGIWGSDRNENTA